LFEGCGKSRKAAGIFSPLCFRGRSVFLFSGSVCLGNAGRPRPQRAAGEKAEGSKGAKRRRARRGVATKER